MKNVLNIANFSGNQIKQGDKSLIKIKLYNNRNNEDIEQLPAVVTLAKDDKVVFKVESIVHGGYVDFKIDKILPIGEYEIEIVVDERFVFPSDQKAVINIVKSHEQLVIDELGVASLEQVTEDVLTRVQRRDSSQYVHTQQVASNIWVVEHNLGKYPSVTIVDSAGREVTGSVEHVSVNKVIIRFENAFSGMAYFN